MSTAATYEDAVAVVAEVITEATGEPRVGRLERALAKSAIEQLRQMGLISTPVNTDAPRSPEHVVRTCAKCGHDPHGVGMICWHEHCPCRGNGARS